MNLQQELYGKLLQPRLERLASEDADVAQLGAVHHTAESHGLGELARTAAMKTTDLCIYKYRLAFLYIYMLTNKQLFLYLINLY